MAHQHLADAVPDGEALQYTDDLRGGGSVGLTDERLLVADGEVTSVELGDVSEVRFQGVDHFELVMGLLLVGFGAYSTTRRPALGALFAAAGVVSLLLTYRKRSRAAVEVHSRPKPLDLYPVDGQDFLAAFERALDDYRERVEPRDPAQGEDP
jgi:hypothetical protein